MIPVYAVASFLELYFYTNEIYFSVISDCYEAFAIASFFALLCHYVAPNLHDQKEYFRSITAKPWVWPVNWLAKCFGGEKGIFRTPRSGLTWFNIIWTGIYQYCFIRVAMTITAVVTQYFGRYCESSDSPVFAHVWILVIESIAVSFAMYFIIQFYIQLRKDLAPHSPFLKVAAIKLIIFLSFWQSFMISFLTSSSLNIITPSSMIAYPDIQIGIPALLQCVEMALFSFLHIFAFPWSPYANNAAPTKYPMSPTSESPSANMIGPKQGGFLGLKAFVDALNPWDMVKAFARGMRWLFVGVKHREQDPSYQNATFNLNTDNENDMTLQPTGGKEGKFVAGDLPIANEFRRSKFGMPMSTPARGRSDEAAGLITNAQPNPLNNASSGYVPARQRYDADGQDISDGMHHVRPAQDNSQIGLAMSGEPGPYQAYVSPNAYEQPPSQIYLEQLRQERRLQQEAASRQWPQAPKPITPITEVDEYSQSSGNPHVHNALWGNGSQPGNLNHGAF
ncbi:hypothetical protein BP6252_05839 [Coleophoma cylindrospora]|uniref:DUF300-domain-containing protein n=1 Tax=Coleophoma cylindrospora TaxID=1849047 RepID=A0A3D8RUY6_9HELO|nr:hypothetical protein BP6252_05839 [Coleophoma cylindrospora]